MDGLFGKCPVCGKFLKPRCRFTGEPKYPPVGAGILSRARCDSCGAIIEYVGNGNWTTFDSKARREMFRRHGFEMLVLDDRIDFIHPERDLFAQDAKKGGAWYATAWWCWKMLPQQVVLQEPVQRRLL